MSVLALDSLAPLLDVAPEPQPGAALATVDRRLGKRLVPAEVRRHAAAVAESEDLGHVLRVDEFVGVHGRRHKLSLTMLTEDVPDG